MVELRRELGRLGIEVEHLRLDYDEIQADTLEEVIVHALETLRQRGLDNFIIDDSGLFIDALRGFPGVYSAYVLRTLGCDGILRLMENVQPRGARFRCCIGASVWGRSVITNGESVGRITTEKRGSGGFGFDPIFLPDGGQRTYAEIPLEEKNAISHRGRALRAFAAQLHALMEAENGPG